MTTTWTAAEVALVSGIASAFLAVLAAFLLTKGGEPYPWAMQSYSGDTLQEIAHRERAKRMRIWGWVATGGTAVLSSVAAVLGYFS
jgi:hypothetical protein